MNSLPNVSRRSSYQDAAASRSCLARGRRNASKVKGQWSKVAPNRLRYITHALAPDRIAAIGSQALANLRDVLGIYWDIASVRCDAVPEVLDDFESILDRQVVQIRHDIIE